MDTGDGNATSLPSASAYTNPDLLVDGTPYLTASGQPDTNPFSAFATAGAFAFDGFPGLFGFDFTLDPALIPGNPTEYIEALSSEMAFEMSNCNLPAGMEFPTEFLDYVSSVATAHGLPASRYQHTHFDPVAFVSELERVNIADIPAEDMRCAHCWLPFGTTDEDEPDYTFTPDPEDPPELAARQVAFHELPFHVGRTDNDSVRTPCGHLFGQGCLLEIVETMGTLCPTCRQEMRL